MFEPSWFIAGNVAVSKMNGFDVTLIGDTYAEAEGGVCELVTIVGVNSINRYSSTLRPVSEHNRITNSFSFRFHYRISVMATSNVRLFPQFVISTKRTNALRLDRKLHFFMGSGVGKTT